MRFALRCPAACEKLCGVLVYARAGGGEVFDLLVLPLTPVPRISREEVSSSFFSCLACAFSIWWLRACSVAEAEAEDDEQIPILSVLPLLSLLECVSCKRARAGGVRPIFIVFAHTAGQR